MTSHELRATRAGRRWRRVRLALAAAWIVVLGLLLAVGTHEASWGALQTSLSDGRVTSVQVVGELEPGSTGYSLAEVLWRDGVLQHRTEVMQVSADLVDSGGAPSSSVQVTGGVGDRLRTEHPGLALEQVSRPDVTSELFGWQVTWPLGAVALSVALLTLMLILGPTPWWATRWAWFWLGTNPVGVMAFLVLSGPTPGVPAPDDPASRLTGGWALLLSLLVGGLTGAALR